MDCMMGSMFPSSPPASPPSSNPRPSRALTRSSPASPEVCKATTQTVCNLFKVSRQLNESDFTDLQVVCIFGQATESFFKTGREFLLGFCVGACMENTDNI